MFGTPEDPKVAALCVTEPNAGSDVSGLRTTASRDGDSWVLNGTKVFITNGGIADVHIVVATGLYVHEELPHQYAYRGPGLLLDQPEPMVADFTRDIVDGIGGTGVKAAFLKCCVEAYGLTPGVERIARAVARTHRETGVPITVHTSGPARSGRLAVDLFGKEGVDLTKVVVGHAGDSNDLDYLMELADHGVTLGMDRFGLDLFNPTADRVRTIAALAARGYADRMVLAHDANCFIDWFGGAHDAVRAVRATNLGPRPERLVKARRASSGWTWISQCNGRRFSGW